jgi:hypothetical protein
MNYIKLLNNFWSCMQADPLPPTAQLLYYTLLQICNQCGWAEWFRRTNQNISSTMQVSVNTMIAARNKLKQRGLIEFIPSKRRGESTKYKICYTQTELQAELQADQQADQQAELQTDHINKLKQKQKLKQKNNTPHISPQAKKEEPDKVQYAEFVTMTNAQYEALIERFGEAKTKGCIEILDNYKGSKGKKYEDDYRTILNWVEERYDERQKNRPRQIPTDYGDFD